MLVRLPQCLWQYSAQTDRLCPPSLSRYYSVIKEVVNDLHRGLSGAVYVKDTLTDPFPYAIGVYQGDPLSVATFNTITCLLCDALSSMSMSTVGYQISSTKDTVGVFADDAVLISNSLKNSQRQCNMVETFLQWTGIQAKVVKCRSLAFRSRPRSISLTPICRFVVKRFRLRAIQIMFSLAFLLTYLYLLIKQAGGSLP